MGLSTTPTSLAVFVAYNQFICPTRLGSCLISRSGGRSWKRRSRFDPLRAAHTPVLEVEAVVGLCLRLDGDKRGAVSALAVRVRGSTTRWAAFW